MGLLKQAYIDWYEENPVQNPVCVTFTEKQVLTSVHKHAGPIKTWINNQIATQNFSHFLNLLNRKIFKNSYRRYNKKLQTFIVHENNKDRNVRHHIHGFIEQPEWISDQDFDELMNKLFAKTLWGYRAHEFNRPDNNKGGERGWLGYCLKEKKIKSDKDLWVDLENTYLKQE